MYIFKYIPIPRGGKVRRAMNPVIEVMSKIYILGRTRKVHILNKKQHIQYNGQLIPLSAAKKLQESKNKQIHKKPNSRSRVKST